MYAIARCVYTCTETEQHYQGTVQLLSITVLTKVSWEFVQLPLKINFNKYVKGL